MNTRNYKFRLYPSRNQEADLIQVQEGCRWLFNHMLQRKNEGWRYPQIQGEIPSLVKEHTFLGDVHSKTRQYIMWQLKANIKALGELKKKGLLDAKGLSAGTRKHTLHPGKISQESEENGCCSPARYSPAPASQRYPTT